MLVHSRLPGNNIAIKQGGTSSCRRPRCKTCGIVTSKDMLVGPTGSWRVQDTFTCTSTNLVYCLMCNKCEKLYIGETKRRLADRVTEHLRSVRLNTPGLPVASHFNLANHNVSDMRVCGVKLCNDLNRKELEEKIIFRLGCKTPLGMNVTFRAFRM